VNPSRAPFKGVATGKIISQRNNLGFPDLLAYHATSKCKIATLLEQITRKLAHFTNMCHYIRASEFQELSD